uniref:Nuclear receptor subfamily 5, group A, member 1b n=1 Tax=Gadus morhua TaxID=8049 RepID=A0A8C5C837_GADMO
GPVASRPPMLFDADLDMCPVCGDTVSGYHYGLLTCESCKGFFKRTVQNNKSYTCSESQDCRIDKTQRKRCPFCRFQKCLRVGMRLEAVRADRMRGGRNRFGPMYKRHRALKQQKNALLQSHGLKAEYTPDLISPPTRTPFNFTNININTTPSDTITSDLHTQTHSGYSFYQNEPRHESPQYYHVSPLGALYSPVHAMAVIGDCSGIPGIPQAQCSGSFSAQGPALPHLLVEFLRCELDELQVRSKIIGRLEQMQGEGGSGGYGATHMYLMVDQMLFYIVEWARGSVFFKELKVSDQMKLLHHCWCELLVLDMVSRQLQHGRQGSLVLVTGQEVDLPALVSPAGPLLRTLVQKGQDLVESFRKLQVDRNEVVCFKFLILFNTDVKHVENQSFVENVKEQVHRALLEYTLCAYPQFLDKFDKLLLCWSDLCALSTLAEEYLCSKDICGEVPCNNLLNELLHAKHHSM